MDFKIYYVLIFFYLLTYIYIRVMTFFNIMFLRHKPMNFCSKLMKSGLILFNFLTKLPLSRKFDFPYARIGLKFINFREYFIYLYNREAYVL